HGPLGSASVFDPKSGPFAELAPSDVDSLGKVLRDHLPVDALYEVKVPMCGTAECFVTAVRPAAKGCPYSYGVLQRDPTREEQAAARRDPKCQGAGDGFHIESVLGMPALVVEERDVAAVTLADPAEVERIVAALRAGAVVVDDPRNVENGQVTLLIKPGI